jgi:hypothetical protein
MMDYIDVCMWGCWVIRILLDCIKNYIDIQCQINLDNIIKIYKSVIYSFYLISV